MSSGSKHFDRVPTQKEREQMAGGAAIKRGRALSLVEVAEIINRNHPMDRPMRFQDVQRIEERALEKARQEWQRRYGTEFPC